MLESTGNAVEVVSTQPGVVLVLFPSMKEVPSPAKQDSPLWAVFLLLSCGLPRFNLNFSFMIKHLSVNYLQYVQMSIRAAGD